MIVLGSKHSVLGMVGAALGFTGLGIALVGNATEIWIWADLFMLPEGTAIRPINQTYLSFVVAAWSAAIGLPVCILGLILNWRGRKWPALLGIVLSLTPLLVGIMTLHLAGSVRGLAFKE